MRAGISIFPATLLALLGLLPFAASCTPASLAPPQEHAEQSMTSDARLQSTPPAPEGAVRSVEIQGLLFALPAGWRAAEAEVGSSLQGPAGETVQVALLGFDGAGDVFFAAVEAAARAAPPQSRRYLIAERGIPFGELFVYSEQLEAWAQPFGGHTLEAVRIFGPRTPATEALFESIQPAQVQNTPTDVVIQGVKARATGPGRWQFNVTLQHPDAGWSHFADGWQIVAPDGQILGTRVLLHPHDQEQPFTRSLSGVAIPPEVTEIIVTAHDLVHGYTDLSHRIPLDSQE